MPLYRRAVLPRLALVGAVALVAGAGVLGAILTGSVWSGLGFAVVGGGAAVLVVGGTGALAIALVRSLRRLGSRIRHA